MTEKRSSEIFGGTFLIGLAILFLLNWWWPGIMYVIGISLLVRAVAQGRNWMDERGGLIALGIGIFFTVIGILSFTISWWPIILILIGLYLLFGSRRGGWRSGWGARNGWGGGNWQGSDGEKTDKPKNDDFV